jgi:hypothetical protein
VPRRWRLDEQGRPDIALMAAVGATILVALMQTYHTVGTDRWIVWVDAIANEWMIWFALLYLASTGGAALLERLGPFNNQHRILPK